MNPSILRLAEAARIAGVCTRTIIRWVQTGRLKPAEITSGGEKRYRLADVERLAQLRAPQNRRTAPVRRTRKRT